MLAWRRGQFEKVSRASLLALASKNITVHKPQSFRSDRLRDKSSNDLHNSNVFRINPDSGAAFSVDRTRHLHWRSRLHLNICRRISVSDQPDFISKSLGAA